MLGELLENMKLDDDGEGGDDENELEDDEGSNGEEMKTGN